MPVPYFATSSSGGGSSGGSSGSSSIPPSRLHAAASSNHSNSNHSNNHNNHNKKVSHYLVLLQTTFGLLVLLFGCTTVSLLQRFDVYAASSSDSPPVVSSKRRRAVASMNNNFTTNNNKPREENSPPEKHKQEDHQNHPKSHQPIPPLRDKEESLPTTQNPAKIATKIPAKSGDTAAPAAPAATTTTITSTSSPSPNAVTSSSTTTNKTNTESPPQQQQKSKPQKVVLAHVPRYDLLGSFVAPSLFLHAITSFFRRDNWELAILPFQGSEQERILQGLVAQGTNIDKAWGSGLTEANSRHDYDPVLINAMAHDTMGFFPPILNTTTTTSATSVVKWIRYDTIVKNGILVPPDHSKWTTICQKATNKTNNDDDNTCHVLLSDNPHLMQQFMEQHGGLGLFFTPEYRQTLRDAFMVQNRHRLQHYYHQSTTETTTPQNNQNTYMIAIHVRRGDILDPKRWIQQSVYAKVAQRICRLQSQQNQKQVHVHIFTSGPNKDGNWKELEALAQNTTNATHNATTNTKTNTNHNDNDNDGQAYCSSVSIHRDEQEFDSWTHMIMADAFIMSKSSFSEIPAILARGQVYFPHDYWHPKLPHWTIFHSQTGRLLPQS